MWSLTLRDESSEGFMYVCIYMSHTNNCQVYPDTNAKNKA